MILVFLIFILVVQLISYKILDAQGLGQWKALFLCILLMGNFTLFPRLFYPDPSFKCGMPILGITLAFWVFGNAITLLVHLGHYLFTRKRIKEKL